MQTTPTFRAAQIPWDGAGDAPEAVGLWLQQRTDEGYICRDPAMFHRADGTQFFYLQAFAPEYVDGQACLQEALARAQALRQQEWAQQQREAPTPGSAAALRAYLQGGGKKR